MYVIIYFLLSHPTRDGWIEIDVEQRVKALNDGPIPHGMGGLKSHGQNARKIGEKSHPTRDGWIEIRLKVFVKRNFKVPSHTGWVD